MELKFLGTGGAFDWECGNSSALVSFKGETILIDCGCVVYQQLCRLNLIDKIDAILITHFHDDHVGSLSSILAHRRKGISSEPKKLKVYYPHEKFLEAILDALNVGHPKRAEVTADFVMIDPASGILGFETSEKHMDHMLSFAYGFVEDKKMIVYSGDLADSNFIFQQLAPIKDHYEFTIYHETTFEKNWSHSFYQDIKKLTQFGDVYVYHFNPAQAPEDLAPLKIARPSW